MTAIIVKQPRIRLDTFIAERAQREMHLDASEAVFFARELLKVRTRAFQTLFPEYKALRFLPRNSEVDDTDEAYTYQTFTETGRAELRADYSTTAPSAEVSGVEADPQKIKPIVASYTYDFMEARRSAKLGKELPMRKANAARRAIAQELDRVLTYGDTTKTGVTLYGIANLTGTATYTTPNGASGSKSWLTKTPVEILFDMTSMITQVITASNEIEHPDTLILPLARYELIKNTKMGDGSERTILEQFQKMRPEITVESWFKLDAAPSSEWTGMRMMAYKRDAEKLDAIVNPEFEQLPPDVTAIKTTTIVHARTGGVVLYFPKSVIYGDQI
jgi:hypothetical protein